MRDGVFFGEYMNELALFAGAGGGILGGSQLGWRTRCAVEIDPYARKCLLSRQRDGVLEPFPIWDDIKTFSGYQWRGSIDIVTGGFPCQDISSAGRGGGISGEKSGLWKQMARIVGEVRPRFVFVENSPLLVVRGLGTVIGDLSSMGYDSRWGIVGAHHAGANHQRNRIWIVGKMADTEKLLCDGSNDNSRVSLERKKRAEFGDNSWEETLADSNSAQRKEGELSCRENAKDSNTCFSSWWKAEPNVGRVVNGLAVRLDRSQSNQDGGTAPLENCIPDRPKRLRAIGNGQVPAAMMIAWKTLTQDL